jgi:hypothetical protein
MLRFSHSLSDLSLLTIGDYYYTHDKIMEEKIVTRQGYGMCIGGCNRLCPAVTGYSLVALFSLSVLVKDRPLFRPWSSHMLIIPSTYLLMGAERLITLLSWVSALSGPTDWRWG